MGARPEAAGAEQHQQEYYSGPPAGSTTKAQDPPARESHTTTTKATPSGGRTPSEPVTHLVPQQQPWEQRGSLSQAAWNVATSQTGHVKSSAAANRTNATAGAGTQCPQHDAACVQCLL
jgi:hypothetical protein